MAIPNNQAMTLMILDTLARDIREGKATVDNLCISAESELTNVQDGWTVQAFTGRRILTIVYDVPGKAV